MTPPKEPSLLLCSLLVFGGIVDHFLTILADLGATGTILSPWAYLRKAPYKSLLAIVGAYLFMLASYYMNMLNPLVAIFIGAACSQAFNSLRARAVKKIREGEDAVDVSYEKEPQR